MNLLKYISSFIWMLCSLGIIYAILRMITSVSKTDFSGNGTKIYLILIVLYTLGTIGLGMLVSKKWFYFLIIFIITYNIDLDIKLHQSIKIIMFYIVFIQVYPLCINLNTLLFYWRVLFQIYVNSLTTGFCLLLDYFFDHRPFLKKTKK